MPRALHIFNFLIMPFQTSKPVSPLFIPHLICVPGVKLESSLGMISSP